MTGGKQRLSSSLTSSLILRSKSLFTCHSINKEILFCFLESSLSFCNAL